MNVELDGDEVKALLEILKFSLGSCPLESVTDEVAISAGSVEDLIAKLEKASVG